MRGKVSLHSLVSKGNGNWDFEKYRVSFQKWVDWGWREVRKADQLVFCGGRGKWRKSARRGGILCGLALTVYVDTVISRNSWDSSGGVNMGGIRQLRQVERTGISWVPTRIITREKVIIAWPGSEVFSKVEWGSRERSKDLKMGQFPCL